MNRFINFLGSNTTCFTVFLFHVYTNNVFIPSRGLNKGGIFDTSPFYRVAVKGSKSNTPFPCFFPSLENLHFKDPIL